MKALITSGGRGTRLRPLTHTQNKHLIPIANKPILHYAIDYAVEAGIKEVGIVYGAESSAVPDGIGDGSRWGINITYIPQEAPLGLAHVVKISQKFIGNDQFVFYLGDNIVVGGIRKFIDEFHNANSNCHLTLASVKDPERFGGFKELMEEMGFENVDLNREFIRYISKAKSVIKKGLSKHEH